MRVRRNARFVIVGAVVILTGTVTALAGTPVQAATAAGSLTGASSPAPGGAAGTDTVISLPMGSAVRSYRVFVPDNLPPGPRPVLVGLHFFSSDASRFEQGTNLDLGAARVGALVVYPEGVGYSWNAGTCCGAAQSQDIEDVRFLDAVLDDVSARYAVDPSRLAVGGMSNGAMLAYRYACERSSRIQTFFMASGGPMTKACAFARPVAVLHLHGLADLGAPWAGTTSSPLPVDGIFPPIGASLSGIASRDGCRGWTSAVRAPLVTRYSAAACPTHAAVVVLTSRTLGHRWTTGEPGLALYGFDETSAVWGFVLSRWNQS